MSNIAKTDDQIFEDEVRRIAREIWEKAEYAGATIIKGREVDGVFPTEECINIIEATTSRTKAKAIDTGEKLLQLHKECSKGGHDKAVRCFFITKYEPTADQREALKKIMPAINALQYTQFQQKLVNAGDYINLRENYPFGSARDPETNDINPSSGYIEMDILQSSAKAIWSVEKIKNSLTAGQRFCLLGDYGAGKSMTLREIYKAVKINFLNGTTDKFPIYINLRDHQGQTEPSEVFLRHATNIGFKHADHLIRAWRAGYVVLILDGFDEIGTIGWTGQWKKLRELRHRAIEVVRKFNSGSPANSGVICAGRAHFFDNDPERRSALGLNNNTVDLSLNDFSDEQISRYLVKCGIKSPIPSWLPGRPLLIGYLASKGLIGEIIENEKASPSANDAASGWDTLLGRIADREADMEAGIDGYTLRRVMERIATKARGTADGLGPISQRQLSESFTEICGYAPNDAAMVLLQRLPGLGAKTGTEELRVFIHEDLTDICRVGDLVAFVSDPFSFPLKPLENLECLVGEIGQEVLARKTLEMGVTPGKLDAAIQILSLRDNCNAVLADLALSGIHRGFEREKPVFIRNVAIKKLDLADMASSAENYIFQDCFITELELSPDKNTGYPQFYSSFFGNIIGRVSLNDIPAGIFDKLCIVDHYESSTSTLSDIMELDLPLGQRVLLSVLKKLYIQKGSGRRENSLLRGLDAEARRIVPDVLHLLKSDQLVYSARHAGNTVWYPVRSQTRRVYSIINSPTSSKDLVLVGSANFSS